MSTPTFEAVTEIALLVWLPVILGALITSLILCWWYEK
jgi:hypothetical protein